MYKPKKYKYNLEYIYGFCQWRRIFPPDRYCILGIEKEWTEYNMIEYRICFFGFELRIEIKAERI